MGRHTRAGAHRANSGAHARRDRVDRNWAAGPIGVGQLCRSRAAYTSPRPAYTFTCPVSVLRSREANPVDGDGDGAGQGLQWAEDVAGGRGADSQTLGESAPGHLRGTRAAMLAVGVGAVLVGVVATANAGPGPSVVAGEQMVVSAASGGAARPAFRAPLAVASSRPAPKRVHPASVRPAQGVVTSAFGPRWQAVHYGLDIANDIGSPIYSPSDGVVIESGPASGFGLWVRIRQDDGTIGVYGHINDSLVSVGQRIETGQQVATVGNRGNSTGPHLHYEVWESETAKVDPAAWLRARGVTIGEGVQ